MRMRSLTQRERDLLISFPRDPIAVGRSRVGRLWLYLREQCVEISPELFDFIRPDQAVSFSELLAHDVCSWPEGVEVRLDGVHETEAHEWEEAETIEGCTVQILRCKRCGAESVGWRRPQD